MPFLVPAGSITLEFLGFKWASTEKFHKYLLGHKCVVFADNNPLCHLHSAKPEATKQERAAQLAAFDFEIKYTDALSRQCLSALLRQWDHLVGENSVIFHGVFTYDPASKG